MALTHTPAWHARQEAIERAWLDQWARLHTHPDTTPEPAAQPAHATGFSGMVPGPLGPG